MSPLELGTFQVFKRHMWLVATALHNRVPGVFYVEIIVFVRSDSDEDKYEYKYKSEKAKKKSISLRLYSNSLTNFGCGPLY